MILLCTWRGYIYALEWEGPLVDRGNFYFCNWEKSLAHPFLPPFHSSYQLHITPYLSSIHLFNRESHSYTIIPGMFNPRPNQSSWAASAHQKQEVVFPPLGLPRRNHGSCDQRVNKAKKATRPTYSLTTSSLRYSYYLLSGGDICLITSRHIYIAIILHSHWTLSFWNTFPSAYRRA